jgi:hypothetical protein
LPDNAAVAAPSNEQIATALEHVSELLEEQGANQYRVDAYRRGAYNVRGHLEPAAQFLARAGLEGLMDIPGVGPALARAIQELLQTGRLRMLERLKGEVNPEALLASVRAIGKGLAERIHHDLGIETLEELELAAHDGRLEKIAGFGPKRIESVRAALAARLGRGRRRPPPADEPPTDDLLDVDREYREKASAGSLRTIAPARFNPQHRSWLPVLHTHRDGREYMALFPTPNGPIAWQRPMTGSSSTTTATRVRAAPPWSPARAASWPVDALCVVASSRPQRAN